MSKKLTQSQAEELFDDLRAGFLNIEILLRKIIETEAWIPLGYDTFTQAWSDKMRGVKLAQRAAASVIAYVMLEEGATVEEVVTNTQGKVTETVAAKMKELQEQGVPLEVAKAVRITAIPTTPPGEHVVRPHRRANPDPTVAYLHIPLGSDYVKDLKEFCEERRMDLLTEATHAIRAHFNRKGFSA